MSSSGGSSGGGATNAAVVRKFAFHYNTPNILTGAALYTPTVGDILLDAWVEIDTAWDGTTPLGDFGPFESGGGLYANLGAYGAPIDMTAADSDSGTSPPDGVLANYTSVPLSLAAVGGNNTGGLVKFTSPGVGSNTDIQVFTGVGAPSTYTFTPGFAPSFYLDTAGSGWYVWDGTSWTSGGSPPSGFQLGVGVATGSGLKIGSWRAVPSKFTAANPIKVVVSQDGTNTGADPGSTVGSAVLYLVTATPA